jgi:hypothetical protein
MSERGKSVIYCITQIVNGMEQVCPPKQLKVKPARLHGILTHDLGARAS